MSDITPMAAVPSEVNYGRIRANFVAFIADDNGNVLEEVPLEGNVILTPTVGVLRFPSTSPPRTAVIQTLQCPVIGGILYPPGTPLGGPFPSQTGVAAVASDQPAGLPTTVQWTASFSLKNTSAQPNPVTFEVPSGGVVDLTTVMPATPEPGIVVVVSTEDLERAEAAAAEAEGSAGSAFDDAAIAQGARLGAEAARDAAEAAADTAETAATVAVTAKTLAEGFAGDAETARSETTTARDEAVTARNQAVTARSETTTARDDAVTARDQAVTANAAAQGWATSASLKADNAAASATAAAGSASNAAASATAAASSATAAQAAALQDTGFRLSQQYAWLNPVPQPIFSRRGAI